MYLHTYRIWRVRPAATILITSDKSYSPTTYLLNHSMRYLFVIRFNFTPIGLYFIVFFCVFFVSIFEDVKALAFYRIRNFGWICVIIVVSFSVFVAVMCTFVCFYVRKNLLNVFYRCVKCVCMFLCLCFIFVSGLYYWKASQAPKLSFDPKRSCLQLI